MVKIGSAVHTAHGLGKVTEVDTVRGRKSYKVAGNNFAIWLDETKVAALGDVDESNSTTLPYDYAPQHPVETFSEESDFSPTYSIDADERTSPTNSVTGESESDPQPSPGPNPDLFAKSAGNDWPSEYDEGDYSTDELAEMGERHNADAEAMYREYLEDKAHKHAAGGWGDVDVHGGEEPDESRGESRPGSHSHYLEYAHRNGMHPGNDLTADRYAREHGIPIALASDLAMQVGIGHHASIHEAYPGKHRKAPEPEVQLPHGAEVWDAEDWLAAHPDKKFADPREQARYEEWKNKTVKGDSELFDRFTHVYDPEFEGELISASYRPAGLSDKYIDILPTHTASWDDPVEQFRRDPIVAIQRTAYLVESSTGLDPRMGQYMDLVDADPIIREAAWSDVRTKAMRLKSGGAVHVKDMAPNRIMASVDGDNATYDVVIYKGASLTGSNSIDQWHCGCEWGKWAFRRKHTFVGRLCSHGLAAYFTMQSAHQTGQPRQTKLPKKPTPSRSLPFLHVKRGGVATREFLNWCEENGVDPYNDPDAETIWARNMHQDSLGDVDFADLDLGGNSNEKPLKWGPGERSQHYRAASIVDDFKDWVRDVNKGHVDIGAADDFLGQYTGDPTPDEVNDVIEYAHDNPAVRPGRNYEVGTTFDLDKAYKSASEAIPPVLKNIPDRITPDYYVVPEGEEQKFIDVESDERKTTGPDQITAGTSKYAPGGKLDRERKAQEQAASNQKIDNAFSGWQGRVHPSYHDTFDNAFDFFHDDMVGTDQYEDLFGDDDKRNAVYDRLQSKFPLTSRNAKVDKKWADDHAGLDDGEEHQPIVHFSALTYTADENLLKKLRDLSAESNAENFGNMAQHNHEISEVIGELHDRGYDANRLVASLRTADSSNGIDDYYKSIGITKPENSSGGLPSNPFAGGGFDPTKLPGVKNSPNTKAEDPTGGLLSGPISGDSPASTVTNAGQPQGNGGGGGGGPSTSGPSAGGSGFNGGGGGSDWKPNGITDAIGAGDYKIQSGDTLTSIMDRAKGADGGLGVSDLAKSNNISNPDLIFAGDTLHIPGTATPAPAAGAAEAGGAPPVEPGAAAPMSGVPGPPGVAGPTPPGANAGPPPESPGAATFAPGAPVPPTAGGPSTASIIHNARRRYAEETGRVDDKGVKIPGNGPGMDQTPDVGSKREEPKTQTLEERLPGSGQSTSTSDPMSALGGGSVTQMVGPVVNGITQGISGLAGGGGLSGLASGVGSALGGLSGLLSFASVDDNYGPTDSQPDPSFAGTGPYIKDWWTTSEDYVEEHEKDHWEDVTEGAGDITNHTKPRQQPKQALKWDEGINDKGELVMDGPRRYWPEMEEGDSWDDDGKHHYTDKKSSHDDASDIVRQFQANIGDTALGAGAGGGGSFSDAAIAERAQGFLRTAGRVYSLAEQQELIDEAHPKGARNLSGLDLRGTHYLDN